MISVYCDEDVDVLIKPLLEAKGFKVFTSLNEKMLGTSDTQQIDHAIKKKCVFLTHNRVHYEKLYSELAAKGIIHYGIIVAARRNVYELAKRVSRVLSIHSEEKLKNLFIYI
ncbi:MAG: DUF5615 family PIN-like protein [Thermodesulfovibrionales bacterium]